MVTVTGTATDAQDLFDKLIAFLTTNATLVGAGQEWSQVWAGSGSYANDRVLMGQGLSGTDEIYVGMRLHVDVPADEHWIEFRGMTGWLTSATQYTGHTNVCSRVSRLLIDNSSMDYTFIANGRRFIVVLKISTVFEACYCGFFLPYGVPSEYPYPLFIGASTGGTTAYSNVNSWRDTGAGHNLFPMAYADSSISSLTPSWTYYSSANMMDPQGNWVEVDAQKGGAATEGGIGIGTHGSYAVNNRGIYASLKSIIAGLTDAFGGEKALIPVSLFQVVNARQTFGVLQGVYLCQGDGMSAEDTITVGGVDHLVVQNAYRTDASSYFAVELA